MAAFNVITVWIKEIYNTELPSCANEFKIVCAALLLDVDVIASDLILSNNISTGNKFFLGLKISDF